MKSMMSKLKYVVMAFAMLCVCNGIQAQGREYIRKAIEEWGECRNVALTKSNGDLALYQENGYAHYGCPEELDATIKELHEASELIDDVQLTESGKWLILYGDNGFRWYGIPSSLESRLKEYNNEGEVVTSATFNDAGEWIIISTNYFSASDPEIEEWLKQGNEKYGKIWAACVTDAAAVAVYENGYQFLGEIPDSLQKALDETDLNVYRLKVAGDAWFFADQEGGFQYEM